ncbi:DnaJ-domain-containing protein [Laetiporus sulphureus 93-53]|uniref:DnaJ-domain-containing protein n=1 Tax=Laetiporus sulphureus 93-53 TaxID=1314785 RepID=A0A165GA16_9APHY|nr:DnaJ-domain-containing protein [Laetiporus sulphureus 93-53]KZT10048.1 DnaJ-domain-containing protein [Laetiporus sulphureus 93-53]
MATNLYEVLGLDREATSEQIRKAYRKRALQTHPDRLMQGMSASDKEAAEEQFRLVNHAYEVLTNEENRKLYDRFGVWPPPVPEVEPQRPNGYHGDSFDSFASDPFFGSPSGFGSRRRPYAFTDPFELYNSLFGDVHRGFFDDNFYTDPFPSTSVPRSPFDRMGDPFGRSMFGGSLFGGLGSRSFLGGSMFPERMGPGSTSRVYGSASQAVGMNGQWVSQSTMTRTINGRTEQITKRRDAQGNEHIVYCSPDGERYTINGIEQPLPNGAIGSAPPPAQQLNSSPPAFAIPPPPPANSYVPPANNHYAAPQRPPQAQVPPQAQAYTTQTSSPPAYTDVPTHRPGSRHSASVASAAYTYPTKPAPPVERVSVQQQQMYTDPHATSGSQRSMSSHGHGSQTSHPYVSQAPPAHSPRDKERDPAYHGSKRFHRERTRSDGREQELPMSGGHTLSRDSRHREARHTSGDAGHRRERTDNHPHEHADEQEKKRFRGGW